MTSTSDSEEEILNDGGVQGDTVPVIAPTRQVNGLFDRLTGMENGILLT